MAWLRAEGLDVRLNALTADVDTPGHVPWTADLLAEFNAMWALRAGPLATCGLYLSPKGYRLIQPLRTKLRAEEGERALKAWIERLVAVGVWSNVREVRDWTRHMRTPHHLRNGVAIIAPRQDWDSCEAIDAEVPDDDAAYRVVEVRNGATLRGRHAAAADPHHGHGGGREGEGRRLGCAWCRRLAAGGPPVESPWPRLRSASCCRPRPRGRSARLGI